MLCVYGMVIGVIYFLCVGAMSIFVVVFGRPA